jgi:hypothetical protein
MYSLLKVVEAEVVQPTRQINLEFLVVLVVVEVVDVVLQ